MFESVVYDDLLDIHLNIKVLTPIRLAFPESSALDIHLKIKVLTPTSERNALRRGWIFT